MSKQYFPSQSSIDDYYTKQTKVSSIPYYSGVSIQRGHGLGNIFASLFRTIAPVFKSTVAPMVKQGAKALAKEAISTGAQMATAAIAGDDPRIKDRTKEATKRLLLQGAKKLTSAFEKPKTIPVKRKKIARSSKKYLKRPRDIFD